MHAHRSVWRPTVAAVRKIAACWYFQYCKRARKLLPGCFLLQIWPTPVAEGRGLYHSLAAGSGIKTGVALRIWCTTEGRQKVGSCVRLSWHVLSVQPPSWCRCSPPFQSSCSCHCAGLGRMKGQRLGCMHRALGRTIAPYLCSVQKTASPPACRAHGIPLASILFAVGTAHPIDHRQMKAGQS